MGQPSDKRRHALGTLVAALLALYVRPLQARMGPVVADDTSATSYDAWMAQWMGSKVPLGILHLARFADPIYVVTKHFGWAPDPQQAQHFKAVTVPEGFVTDFASIPRVFWSLLPPDGLYTYPAIIHDYLYWDQPVSRANADEIFRFAMLDFKINAATVNVIYQAVRLRGGSAWEDNLQLKKAGEKRLLKRLPDDPTVRWAEWKLKPGVF
jgi:hypothetical protein